MAKRFTSTDKWRDPWFRKLPLIYKVFWTYILDNCNSAGVWNVDFDGASFDIGQAINPNEIEAIFSGRIEVLDSQYWFIPKFPEFQYGRLSDDCKPHKKIIEVLKKHGLFERVSKGFAKGSQRLQDKEEDKEKDSSFGKSENLLKEETEATPEKLIGLWNTTAHPNLPRVKMLTDTRKRHIKARLVDYPQKDFWVNLMERVNKSKFLRGESGGDRPWRADFDWVMNPTNLAKIIEGNYDNR